jgi:hypothetical protein
MNNYEEEMKELRGVMDRRFEKQVAFAQHVLLLSSSLFGILIALHSSGIQSPPHHWVFALANSLLAAGILGTAIGLYGHVDTLRRAQEAFARELQAARSEHRDARTVAISARNIFLACEKSGYIFLLLSVLMLALYSVLSVLC